jgi:adenylate kinase
MNIILLGPPGAGKGTQARMLQKQHQLEIISTGEILKDEIKKTTPLGMQVKDTIESGRFLSDDIILQIFEDHVKKAKQKGLILDGVPRTLNQAEKIDKLFENLGLELDVVIQLTVDDKELVKRLSRRMVCKTCHTSYTLELPPRREGICDKCQGTEFIRRPDDEPEAIKTRLKIYNEQTKPLLHYYDQTNRLKVVDGMKSVKEVNAQIESLLRDG